MILGTATCVKVLLPVLAGVFLWLKFKNALSAKCRVGLVALCVLFACFANMAAGHVPPLTDTVTLTALGETGQAGKGQEVFVTGYTVDGEAHAPKNAVEGKWFWIGGKYCWRPETDARQPEGTTRSVQLEVPVGWERAVNFSRNEWRGWVEVSTGDQIQQIDTSAYQQIGIGRSHTKGLILNQIRYLAVYSIVFAVLAMLAWLYIVKIVIGQRQADCISYVKEHKSQLFGIAVSIFFFIICLSIKPDSLWLDELYQVAFSGLVHNPIEAIFKYYSTTPPLYTLLMYFWYQIAPYGEQWLSLPSIVFSAVSVYVISRCGYIYCGKRGSYFSAIAAASSGTILYQCALEFRTYGLLFLLATVTFYVYLKAMIEGEHKNNYSALYTFLMILLAYTHYFGVFFCGALFLVDCIFVYRKRKKSCQLLQYVVALVAYIPWIMYWLEMQGPGWTAAWQGVPTFSRVIRLLQYLNGYVETRYVLFLVGVAVVVVKIFIRQKNDKQQSVSHDISLAPVLVMGIYIVCVFIYGKFISPDASLWVNRYFVVLLPVAIILSAQGCVSVMEWIERHSNLKSALSAGILFVLLIVMWPATTTLFVHEENPPYQPYRERAEWLLNQNDLYSSTTLVIVGDYVAPTEGWYEYYLTRQGQLDAVNMWNKEAEVTNETLSEFDRIYVCKTNYDGWIKVLAENFKQISYHSDLKIWVYARAA